ncbi:MAG: hypothetical protein RIQ89_698 [Bacteroidota bacterium]|jgi:hypothetical protein
MLQRISLFFKRNDHFQLYFTKIFQLFAKIIGKLLSSLGLQKSIHIL